LGESLKHAAAWQLQGMNFCLDVDLVIWEPRREIHELPSEHPTSHRNYAEDHRRHQQDCGYAPHPTFEPADQRRQQKG